MEYSDWLKYNEEPEYTCPMCGTEVRRLAEYCSGTCFGAATTLFSKIEDNFSFILSKLKFSLQ